MALWWLRNGRAFEKRRCDPKKRFLKNTRSEAEKFLRDLPQFGSPSSSGLKRCFSRHKPNFDALLQRGGDSVEHGERMTVVVGILQP